MKQPWLLAFLLLGGAAAWLNAAPPGENWGLVFSDEFNGTTADLDKTWASQNGPSGHILCSRWRENAIVEDGLCRLLNKKQTRAGQDWTSASLWTKRQFKYGYFECRYRYGKATGLNNSFWLMTVGGTTNTPGRFEIDINEGHFPDSVNMNIHNWSGKHWSKSKAWQANGHDLSQEFHVFALEWTEQALVWFFDGREIRRETNSICHGPAPVWLSSAIIKWAGPVTDAIDGTAMEVDYVRVYEKRFGVARQQAARSTAPDLAAMRLPIPATAKFSDPDFNIWCGSPVKGDGGQYHLFYSRWPRKLGHIAWVTHSEVAHAVSDSPFGPWKHRDVALPARGTNFWDGSCTHNPTVIRLGGRFHLYYMGNHGNGVVEQPLNWTHRNHQRIGVAVADSPDGPWTRFDKPLVEPTPGFYDALCCNNPSVTTRPGGGYLMVYKAVGDKGKLPFGGPVLHCVATSNSPTGPFKKHPKPIFVKEGVQFAAEDPFIWNDGRRFWAVVKDNAGHFTHRGYSLALWESQDGFDWKLARHPLVATPEVTWADGRKQKLDALERPQVLLDNGLPIALFCAAADAKGRDGSFNIQIPLKP